MGGNLDTIAHIKDKSFFPNLELWKDTIIFLETSENKMKPEEFASVINNLSKEINNAKAIIFGKPKDETFFEEYLTIVKEKITKPVIFNMNFGHAAPNRTMPYGGTIEINPKDKLVKITK
ncbi:hypothetical protein [Mycoplasma todarodis]|uniref:LD-carboxypeptidase C-terminal domain-containing protein n=1 Tax=Mycoplasma todarodis TaxID=1937191 RepID=A0A4R0XK89_9MOLU|nr:hypothetical protein [Mycoplasma todarodis]TCG11066.1 hypothetical protein C4B25_02355 [Mycoplasma todarodis]